MREVEEIFLPEDRVSPHGTRGGGSQVVTKEACQLGPVRESCVGIGRRVNIPRSRGRRYLTTVSLSVT